MMQFRLSCSSECFNFFLSKHTFFFPSFSTISVMDLNLITFFHVSLLSTLTKFRGQEIYISSLFQGVALFLFIFSFSMLLGVVFGLGCSLMLKHSKLSQYPALESCLVMLIAYTSYFFSNGITLSGESCKKEKQGRSLKNSTEHDFSLVLAGIVSLLFCGITLKHYAYHNMSLRTQRTTRYIFQTLANVSFLEIEK